MPGFTTHYLFGLDTYQHMDNLPLKQLIKENCAAYSFGLQGPDLFFYYLPSYIIHKENIGSVAHTQRAGKFLHHLLDSRKLFNRAGKISLPLPAAQYSRCAGSKFFCAPLRIKKAEQQIAESYIAGFLGHYILDTHCHPYIYYKSGFKETNCRYHGKHMALETDIDTELLQFYKHCPPSAFRQSQVISLTPLQMRTIAAILYYAYRKTFPELHISYATMLFSICSMQLGTACLRDVSGRKKSWIRRLEKLFPGYPLISSLIPGDTPSSYDDPFNALHSQWQNPWEQSLISNDSFFDLMDTAQEHYLEILNNLNLLFHAKMHTQEDTMRTKKLLKLLGNLSYHSGLPLPSA